MDCLFLTLDAHAADAKDIEARLKKHGQVARYRHVPRAAALKQLKTQSGLADVLASLPQNPLPDAFVVEARTETRADARDAQTALLEKLRDEFKAWPKVEQVQLDAAWSRRLEAALRLGRLAVWSIALMLGFALVAVTFNTIRLQIVTQRAQIEVAKLIGATDGYVRRPFLYYGALMGILGGLTACLIVFIGIYVLNGRLAEFAGLYGSLSGAPFRLSPPAALDALLVSLTAASLGWLGAWLSANRHLVEFRPRIK